MPERDWTLRVHDMLQCIAKIERYTAGLDLAGFEQDERTVETWTTGTVLSANAGQVVLRTAEGLRHSIFSVASRVK